MTEEQKQALIEYCERVLNGSNNNSPMEQVYKVALAALTAPPVKLMDCDFGDVSHMSGGSKDYCNGFVDGTQNAIKAIRAAGYQVEGE